MENAEYSAKPPDKPGLYWVHWRGTGESDEIVRVYLKGSRLYADHKGDVEGLDALWSEPLMPPKVPPLSPQRRMKQIRGRYSEPRNPDVTWLFKRIEQLENFLMDLQNDLSVTTGVDRFNVLRQMSLLLDTPPKE